MRMTRLAFLNFKGSFKNYLSLVLSLSFTLMIFLNFQNVVYSDAFLILGERNKYYLDMAVQAISIVLGCFMFFFVWYSTNVFLGNRKRQIGIYAFMGLSNQKIGQMYLIETFLIGLSALILGILLGIVTTGLFFMIVFALSDLAIDIRFQVILRPVLVTTGVYLVIYSIFSLKGYFNIVRSSVLSLISASRQNEYVRQKAGILSIKAVLGAGTLGAGYYMAIWKDNGQVTAVALVTLGVYLLFGGLIPLFFQGLAKNKKFLYCRQRNLWVNSVIFRMKKNYRTYAIACVLALCSVTALAASFAFKLRYDERMNLMKIYSFQILGDRANLEEEATELIRARSEIAYHSRIRILFLEGIPYGILPFSELRQLAQDVGLEFELQEPGDGEIIVTSHPPLLSLILEDEKVELELGGNRFEQTENTREPYLGYLQDYMDFCIVNDSEYESLCLLGSEVYVCNYQISDLSAFSEIKESLDILGQNGTSGYSGRVAVNPNDNDLGWIKVLYSLGIFMFLVFILASGCIMFMKLYNDAFEERERYGVMRKIGIDDAVLTKALARELLTAYGAPFLVMAVSSHFSVYALEKMMSAKLFAVNVVSVSVVFVIFLLFYGLSVAVYKKMIKVF